MLRFSFPQMASMRGSSPLTSPVDGVNSEELGPKLKSRGAFVLEWGGDDNPEACGRLGKGGGEVKAEGDLVEFGGGEERHGLWMEVGELAVEEQGVVDRSKAPALAPSDSFRLWTGEEVRDGMTKGGGEENFRQSLGDFVLRGSVPHAPWLVAKKSSRDLMERERQ